ncbi:Histidine kinase 5 [Forsythia ovata]|uniref:Histidine kinase 5 n=1 Tax=Forsythia ovata TaxID=205694 RepID=A0ABD1RP75_9LAMI
MVEINKIHRGGAGPIFFLSSESHEAAAEVISTEIKKLEKAIHRIVVRRSTPDCLLFLPSHSHGVPPSNINGIMCHSQSLIEVVGNLTTVAETNRGTLLDFLTKDETISFSFVRGWPSSTYFIEASESPRKMQSAVKVGLDGEIDVGSFNLSADGGNSVTSGSYARRGSSTKRSISASTDSSLKDGMTVPSFEFDAFEGSANFIKKVARFEVSGTSSPLEGSVGSAEPWINLKLRNQTYFESSDAGSNVESITTSESIEKLERQSSPVEELSQVLKRADNFLHLILQNAPVVIGHQDKELRYRFIYNHFPSLREDVFYSQS